MKKIISLLLLCLVVITCQASQSYQFSHIRPGRESANMEINCIFRDSDNFVWFGTSRGLLRYNGMDILSPTGGGRSPLNDFIATVQEDALGLLWIKVNDERYEVYDRFTNRCLGDASEQIKVLTGSLIPSPRLVYIDPEKNIWIESDSKLYILKVDGRELLPISRAATVDHSLLKSVLRKDNKCYLLYASGGVELINVSTLRVEGSLKPPIGEEDVIFGCLYVDSRGCIWISNYINGLWRYDPNRNRWELFGKQAEHRISTNSVRDVVEDGQGRIWIATDHGGINIYDPTTQHIQILTRDPYDNSTIISNSVYSLFRDNQNNIWVGYYKRGVSLYCQAHQKFFTQHIKGLLNRNLQDDISVICEDHQGNLWFGTDEFGLVRQNRKTGAELSFRAGIGPLSIGSDVVVCLNCDDRGRVWVGTFQGGLSCYENGRMVHYRHKDGDPNSLANNNIWAIEQDCDGYIWIGTLGGGVQRLDPQSGTFVTFSQASGGISSDYILDMTCRGSDVLYFSTVNGIESLDVRSFERKMLLESGEAKHMNIFRDSRSLLWIVSKNGDVMAYHTKQDRMVNLPSELQGKNVKSVIEDDNKNMWLATDNSIYNLIAGANPQSGEYLFASYCYKRYQGAESPGMSYNVRSIARTSSGEVILGSVNGYYVIAPGTSLLDDSTEEQHHVFFTSLQVNNIDVRVDSLYDGRVILNRAIEYTKSIELRHKQNRLTLGFSSLNYTSPFRTEYFYQLEGFSDEWLPVTGERNTVTFTNLSPGEYRMRIRQLNTDGSLGQDAGSIEVVVHPPFWRTTVAYLFYALLVFLCLWGCARMISRRQRRKFEMQRAEMEVDRQNQLNEMKIRFFTNISHDFRTPLSLIITPLEEIRIRCGDELRPSLDIVHRNAVRLLNLVNQLLDFRKLDVYGSTLNLSHGDFIGFVREICSSFELLSEDRHVSLSVESSVLRLRMAFDKDKLTKVFMNLLSNAFKYTPDYGHVTITIGTTTDDNGSELVTIAVRDTGIGIPDADKPRIFDRFYLITREDIREGSGIGLHIVREFISLHGGSITVRDNQPHGSIFYFVLPVVKEPEQSEDNGAESENQELQQAPTQRPTILIVEDNAEFRTFMRECLVRDNDIFEAVDGVEALEVLARESINIIISDVMMPRMDGLELCRRVKGNIDTSHIPLILLTARAMQEHELEGLAIGADEYITKPFNLSILRLRIAKLLEHTRTSHELFRRTTQINPSEITITSLDEKLIDAAVKSVEENMDNSEFSVEDLSAKLGMHRTHLYKKLTFITGKSPLEFIRIVRLKRAAQLLERSQMNVSEIAYMVGFNSPKIFARYFREEYGLSPRDYQRSGPPKE